MYDCPVSAFGVLGLQDYATTVDLKWSTTFSNCVLFSRIFFLCVWIYASFALCRAASVI